MTQWIDVNTRKPDENVPVWMWLPGIKQPIIGAYCWSGDGWEWSRCYDTEYYETSTGVWKCGSVEREGDHPTHWMPLPEPPERDYIACDIMDDDSL